MAALNELDRYWCPIVTTGSLTFIASPLWREESPIFKDPGISSAAWSEPVPDLPRSRLGTPTPARPIGADPTPGSNKGNGPK